MGGCKDGFATAALDTRAVLSLKKLLGLPGAAQPIGIAPYGEPC